MTHPSLDINGIKTHFKIQNEREEKTLFFLHGWGGTAESFKKLSEEIDSNTRTICIDLPGFGKSDMPPKDGWTTHDYADWLHAFLKHFLKENQKASFYGHSFGCRILVRLALRHPELIDNLILTGAAGIKWPPTLKQKTLSKTAHILRPILPKNSSDSPQGLLGKVKRKVLRRFGAHDWETCPTELRPTLTKVLAEPDFREDLKKINIPTLLLWGSQDSYTPLKSAKVYQENITRSSLTIFPDGRHGIHYTHISQISRLANEFLLSSKNS